MDVAPGARLGVANPEETHQRFSQEFQRGSCGFGGLMFRRMPCEPRRNHPFDPQFAPRSASSDRRRAGRANFFRRQACQLLLLSLPRTLPRDAASADTARQFPAGIPRPFLVSRPDQPKKLWLRASSIATHSGDCSLGGARAPRPQGPARFRVTPSAARKAEQLGARGAGRRRTGAEWGGKQTG